MAYVPVDAISGQVVKTVWKTWRGFLRLTVLQKGVVLEATALLTITWTGLRLAGFRRWKYWMANSAVPPAAITDTSVVFDEAASLMRIQQAVARHFPLPTNCLENSFALHWLLRRHEIPATLRIGARKIDGRLEAHAWLEFKGTVLANGDHLPFVPFDGLNASMESQIR